MVKMISYRSSLPSTEINRENRPSGPSRSSYDDTDDEECFILKYPWVITPGLGWWGMSTVLHERILDALAGIAYRGGNKGGLRWH